MMHWTLRQWITLLALSFSVFMISLDVTVVTVALPIIQRDLGLSMERLQWVVSAYSLSFGSLLMAGGTLADRFGRRSVFVVGLVVFAVASVACGLAGDALSLTAARVAQGTGAAFMSSASAALVAGAFQGSERPAAYGVWGAALGLGLAFGPALGGLITEHLSWHWIFLANAPVAMLVLPTVMATTSEARDPSARGVDWGGMLAFSAALGTLIYALNAGSGLGWTSGAEIAMVTASLLLFALLVVLERRHAYPLFDLRLFALPTFVGVSIVPVASSVGYWSLFVYLPLYFDRVLAISPAAIGAIMLPFTLPMLAMPPIAARIARVVAPGHQFAGGLLLIAVGDWLLARAIGGDAPQSLALPLLTAGIGAGLINAQITSVAVSVVPVARAGMASGISATMRQVGYGLGIAGLGAVLNNVTWHGLERAVAATPRLAQLDTQAAFAVFEAGSARAGDPQLSLLILDAFEDGMQSVLVLAGWLTLAGALAALLLVRGVDQVPATTASPASN